MRPVEGLAEDEMNLGGKQTWMANDRAISDDCECILQKMLNGGEMRLQIASQYHRRQTANRTTTTQTAKHITAMKECAVLELCGVEADAFSRSIFHSELFASRVKHIRMLLDRLAPYAGYIFRGMRSRSPLKIINTSPPSHLLTVDMQQERTRFRRYL